MVRNSKEAVVSKPEKPERDAGDDVTRERWWSGGGREGAGNVGHCPHLGFLP